MRENIQQVRRHTLREPENQIQQDRRHTLRESEIKETAG
jgi:hypothetical protein